jgi:hypothetical protein
MPNDAAAEKAGSAEHGDGASVRCHHDSNPPVYIGASHTLWSRNPSAIEQPINLARHDEVVLMESFDLLGAQRDSRTTSAEADVRVMAFCLGKLTDFLNKAARFPEIVESNGPLDAVGRPPLAIVPLLERPEARLPHLPD